MDVPTTLVLLSLNGEQKTFVHTTLVELAKKLWKDLPSAALQRDFLAILRPDLGTHLLYDTYKLGLLHLGLKDFDQLYNDLWCHGLYRNKTDLVGKYDSEIEAESLWLLRGEKLYLVNDDWHIQETINNSFYKII